MNKAFVGLVAAMPEEIRALLQRVKGCSTEKSSGFTFYSFELQGRSVVLVESGMGPVHAAAATQALIAVAAPPAIVNFGFGGAVLPGLYVGDLVLAEQVLLLENGRVSDVLLPDPSFAQKVASACGKAGISLDRGTFVTAATIMNKEEVARTLSSRVQAPVLEMETAAVMREAARAGIPAAAVRGISDPSDLELGFSLEEFCDEQLRIRLPRVLACIARKPWIIPQLLKLSRNSKRAALSLALFVEEMVKFL
jgi:adenosylhomocysteine nucleosidase